MRFIEVADYPSRFDAEFASQDLTAHQIPFIIKSDDLAVGGGMFAASLLVPEVFVDRALALLDER